MRIIRFQAENIKKLKTVEITPQGAVVHLTGANGSGKSSVLDAIYMALAGAKAAPAEPIRQGEQSARVTLDLGELVVTRRFSAGGRSTLTVEAADGAKYGSPQAMLDALLGALCFDPLAFARMEAKEQLAALRQLVPVAVDLDSLDRANALDYDARTVVNRQVADLGAQADAITVDVAFAAGPPVDIDALLGELQGAADHNTAVAAAHLKLTTRREAQRERAARIQHLSEDLRRLMAEHAAEAEALACLPPPMEAIDTAAIRAEIAAGQEANRTLELARRKVRLLQERDAAVARSRDLSEAILGRRHTAAQAIAEAPMPVPGLSFGDGQVLYQGVPFAQCSSAEQLRVSVAIAMAANPTLRVLRVKDGGLLDEASLALLAQLAEDRDYQVWIETAGTHRPGIVMEDGAVRAVAEASA